ncbi:MAG: ABC transporter ATP-binding protein [Shinella sp.]|jgi:peptide/nickel transport system ATP-binding protein|nr:MAG: ABC transporter ATP-binding protein [Shinella sp.]
MTQNAFVKVENLNRVFDVSKPLLNRIIEKQPRRFVNAVTDVNFTIGKGETFALVGESGSGKSTVAKMVVGLLPPTSGRVEIDGVPITGRHDRAERRALRRRMQMIFQDPYASLNPRWRVGNIIAEPMLALSVVSSKQEAAEEVSSLLSLVGLNPADHRKYPHEFSGGQRQRIAIARALASKSEFIVCDEPTSALDVSVQAQILNLMRDLQEQLGLTYLLISHNLAVVRHMASRIGVMHFGKLVEVQESRTLFKAPGHDYTRMLINAVPDISMAGRTAI